MCGRVLWRFCLFQGFVGVFYRVLDEGGGVFVGFYGSCSRFEPCSGRGRRVLRFRAQGLGLRV